MVPKYSSLVGTQDLKDGSEAWRWWWQASSAAECQVQARPRQDLGRGGRQRRGQRRQAQASKRSPGKG